MELSSTAKVILGMVALGRRTGYDIKQIVDKSSRYFWAASYGQIYPELKRLEEAGLLAGEDDSQGGRSRRAYSLTPEGRRAFLDWLASGDELTLELRDEGMLKLFFASALSDAQVQDLLRLQADRHEQIASRLHEIEPAERPADDDFPFLVLDYGTAFHEWSADWYRKLAQRIARRRQ
ncbi:MAG: PadR family transcriptional regulator [Thermoleophilaceae bacterium]